MQLHELMFLEIGISKNLLFIARIYVAKMSISSTDQLMLATLENFTSPADWRACWTGRNENCTEWDYGIKSC